MRKIFVSILFLVVFISVISAQQINELNPLGGEIKGLYVKEGVSEKVLISLTLLNENDVALSVPISSIKNVRITIIDLIKKNADNSFISENVGKTLIDPNDVTGTSLVKNYQLEINNTNNLVTTPNLRLPRGWESFRYKIECEVTGELTPTRSTAITTFNKPANVVEVQNFNLEISSPIWVRDPSGNRDKKILIPIKSTSASFAADVLLSQGAGVSNKTDGPILLRKGNEINFAEIDVQNFAVSPIQIRIKPTDISGVQVVLNGEGCTNDKNDPVCVWNPSVNFKDPFIINSSAELSDLKITSNDGIKKINFTTSSPTSIDRMTIKLNGNKVTLTQISGNSFNFDIDNSKLKDGENTLEFEGESTQGVKLSKKTQTFIKNTKPKLVGLPRFEADGNNKISVKYKLTGALSSGNESRVTLSFKNTGGTVGNFASPNCPENASGEYECSASLTMDFASISDADKKTPRIPVEFKIFATETGKSEELIDGVGFDLLNQSAVQKVFEDIRIRWKNNQISENTAKQEIANNIPEADSAKVEEVWKNVKKESGDASKKKYFNFFKAVGNFALKGFGIPIQIP